jgi:nucleoside-diphosphate-sugar epimerase
VVDKLIYGGEGLLAHLRSDAFDLVVADIRDKPRLETAIASANAVVHLAAIVGEDACRVDEDAAWDINRAGTEAVYRCAERVGVQRFVFVSTCSNYGVQSGDQLATEEAPLNPLSQYARSKVGAEQFLLSQNSGPATTVLRFGTICGVAPRMRFDLLVNEAGKLAAQGAKLDIFAPAAWRPFLHVDDAARAIETVLNAPIDAVRGAVFNVVGENIQKGDLGKIVRECFPGSEVEITDRKPDPRDYRVDGTRVGRELGFYAQLTVRDALLEVARAVSQNIYRDASWSGHSANHMQPHFLRFP